MNKITGLNNIGNTCYLNSALQMLIQNKDLCNLIIDNKNKTNNLNIITNFINEYYSNLNQITPNTIKKIIEIKNKIFIGNKQHDAAEFIIYFFDLINDDLQNKIYSLYGITSETKTKCKFLKCLTISKINETNYYLILSIDNKCLTLDDCYKKYKSYEKLKNENMYYCEKCNVKRNASKRLNIIKWSKHLIIWLKRFDNINGRTNKNNQSISIPINWRHNYTLKGAVIHSGSLYSGHYIYISRNIKTNIWSLCNDSFISIIQDSQINSYLNNAYLLYYIKI
jgi:ubiquitin C-terminal hydrolase